MKNRILSYIISISVIFSCYTFMNTTTVSAASGNCGDNVYWSLDANGTLTISGTGEMENYSVTDDYKANADICKDVPWRASYNEINSVVIKDGVTSIGDAAFSYIGLQNIEIADSVTTIGKEAFLECNNLTSVKLSKNIKTIQNSAFYNCKKLVSIILPESIIHIGDYAFMGCESLYSINTPQNVKIIGASAFAGCINIVSFIIPESINSINSNTFGFCENLRDITIPKSITNIKELAFYGCNNLKNIYFSGTENDWNNIQIDRFNDFSAETTIKFMANYDPLLQGDFSTFASVYKMTNGTTIELLSNGLRDIDVTDSDTVFRVEDITKESDGTYTWSINCYVGDECFDGVLCVLFPEGVEVIDYSGKILPTDTSKVRFWSGNAEISDAQYIAYKQDNETDEIRVVLNGKEIKFDQPPIMAENRILVPIRKIAEAMGDAVMWNEEHQTAFIEHGKQALVIKLLEDNIKIVENEDWTQWKEKQLDVVAFSANGRTLVPVRAFCESLGSDVKWDGDSYTAYITYDFKNKTEKMDAQTFEKINTVYYALNTSSNQFDEFSDDLDEFIMQRDPKIDAVAMGVSDIWAGVQDLISGFNNDVNVMQKSLETMLSNIPDNDLVKIDTKMLNDIKSSLRMNKEYYDISNGIDDKFLQKHPTLKSLNNAINTVGIAYDIASFSAEQLAVIFSNYEMNISHLYSLKTSLEENAVINNEINTAITNLENEYANKFLQIIINTRDELTKFTITEGVDLATAGVFHWGVFTWEQAFKITGATQKGQSLKTFYGLYCFNDALDIAYKNIHSNIKTGNYTKDDVLVMKHLDNIQRALKITAYEAIKNVTNDKETQIYCEKTINEKLNKSCLLWKPE